MHAPSNVSDIYTSTNEDSIRKHKIVIENIVCLIISIFIFSLLLSFIIALYNFVPLTPIAKIHGIIIKFCSSKVIRENIIPFHVPNAKMIVEIVYPNENPLYTIIPYTTGIPITTHPINHNINAVNMSFIISSFNNFDLST